MSREWASRRVHDLSELQDAKPLVFRDCTDCGRSLYTHKAKRCGACAHFERTVLARSGALKAKENKRSKALGHYADMLRITGSRERDGDCIE